MIMASKRQDIWTKSLDVIYLYSSTFYLPLSKSEVKRQEKLLNVKPIELSR